MKEIIGWGSAMIVIPTFGLQVYKQWQKRNDSVPPTTLWFFILALVGAAGQIVYSWMLGNWVYFVVNVCLVITDALGLALAIHGRWVTTSRPQPAGRQGAAGSS